MTSGVDGGSCQESVSCGTEAENFAIGVVEGSGFRSDIIFRRVLFNVVFVFSYFNTDLIVYFLGFVGVVVRMRVIMLEPELGEARFWPHQS